MPIDEVMGLMLGVPGAQGGAGSGGLAGDLIDTNTLALWWAEQEVYADAALTTAAEADGPAHGWVDLTTNAYAELQSGADSVAPTYRASVAALNNKPALQFDGGDFLSAAVDGLVANETVYTIYVVFATSATPSLMHVYSEGSSSSNTPYVSTQINWVNSGRVNHAHRSDINANMNLTTEAWDHGSADGGVHIITARRRDAGTWQLRLDGRIVGLRTGPAITTTSVNRVSIGALVRAAAAEYFTGHIALIMATRADDYAEKEPILADEYGLTTFARRAPGVWTWFNDARAIRSGNQTFVGALSDSGDVQVATFDHTTLTMSLPTVLHAALEVNDHASPGLLLRASDNRLMAFYCRHNDTSNYFLRVSTNPLDASAWEDEVDIFSQLNATSVTYANPVQLSGEANAPIYLFFRNWPGVFYSKSEDGGVVWSEKQELINNGAERPYFRVVQHGDDRIDFVCNDGHPNEVATSLYHFYYQGGNYYQSDGTLINDDGSGHTELPITPATDATRIYDGTTVRSWCWDIAIDSNGYPVIVYAVFPTPASDHRYRYARWNGSAWVDNEICAAGGPLYAQEAYYSGGVCLDHADPDIVYASIQGAITWDIHRYVTDDNGATWTSTQLTSASKSIRPVVVRDHDGGYKLAYVEGIYNTFSVYNTNIVIREG